MNKILYHVIMAVILMNQNIVSSEEIIRSPIFIKNSKEAHELINLLPTIEDASTENIENIKTAKMLAQIFEEDQKLDRAFRSWITTIASGLSTIYQYIVHFWQTQDELMSSTEIDPLAAVIGNISANTAEHMTEFFLDNIIGATLSEQVANAIGQTVQNNVTQITNSIIHDLQDQENPSASNCEESTKPSAITESNNSQTTINYSLAKTLDEILKRENNALEQSGTSLNAKFNGKNLQISFQSTLENNDDSEILVYFKDNRLEINHQKMLLPHQIKLIVSYVLNMPENISTNCAQIVTTIDEKGLITLSMPLLDKKIEHISKIITEIKLLYCGLGVFEKDLIFCNSTNSNNPSTNVE